MEKRRGNFKPRTALQPEPISEGVKAVEEKPIERKPERRERVPLGSMRQKTQLSIEALAYFEKRGEVVILAADRPGRLEELEQAGYRYVTKTELPSYRVGSGDMSQQDGVGAYASMVIGSHENGQPMMGYYMAQPQEYFEEDRNLRQREQDAIIGQIKSGETGQVSPGRDGAYKAGIKIDT
jgi:hypothetical protein